MINSELDWGFIIALCIGIGLLVAAVVWAVWWFKRFKRMVMPHLKYVIKGIANHLKR
jgi:uncharacterized membrane protein YccC